MHIKKIKLTNFKGFKNISFDSNKKFNVIIGENNIGKSTLFESLLVWKSCYDRIINSRGNAFYKADKGNTYIPFGDLSFIRLINDTDLFYETPNKAKITLVIKKDNSEFSLTFELSKPKSIKNSYLRFKTINHREFEKFALFLKTQQIKLNNAIFIYQTKTVSNILRKEPFLNEGQILKKISIGKSGEVLRNKIIKKQSNEIEKLENQISEVLDSTISFNWLNSTKAKKDEHINLKVRSHGHSLDIHLQGSGFLQVAEIFSTIDYLENAINILLIDEPDSHIHAKLQKKLLFELRKINNTQTFVISHNDNFVSELEPNELFYLNQEAKDAGLIKKIELKDFDKIRKDLGGIIITLDKLNYTNNVCFVEGKDDIEYIELLLKKHLKIEPENKPKEKVVFYYLRGKDYLLNKIDNNKRLLSQLFKDKKYKVIYDKDFSTISASIIFDNNIKQKLGQTSSVFRHNGYCIESTIFSNKEKLIVFLSKFYNIKQLNTHFFVEEFFSKILYDFQAVGSQYHIKYNEKFNSQKKDSRPELTTVTYNDYIIEATGNQDIPQRIEFLFNKSLIKDFIIEFMLKFNIDNQYPNETAEFYSSNLFKGYISRINSKIDFFDDNINLLKYIYDID